MEKYYNTSQFAKLISVTPQTLRNWDKNGKLKPHHKTEHGLRYYTQTQANTILNKTNNSQKLHISYARISTSKQKTSLQNQTKRLQTYQEAKGRQHTLITDTGSGLNYKKPGLLKIIDLVLDNQVETITVTHKDRLLRFGTPLLEYIFQKHNTTIEYLENPLQDDKEQIANDILEVLTVYSAKLHGKRAAKAKELAKELSNA